MTVLPQNPAAIPADASTATGVSDVEGALVIKKVGRRIMWYLVALYVISVVDRGNLGFASFSMNRDLGLTPQMYGIGVGVLFLGYALFEVPSNLALARFGARLTLTRIALAFGLVTISMAFVAGPASFYTVRGLLGVAEAGLTPGVFLFLSYWVPQSYRARFNAVFTYSIPVAYVLASLISGTIMLLDGTWGVPGWKWLFILEGLPAVLLGIVGMFYLTDRPKQATWLTEREREWLDAEIGKDGQSKAGMHGGGGFVALLRAPVLWLMCLAYIGIFCGNACLAAWLPQIMHANGVALGSIGMVSALPPLAGVIGMSLVCAHSDRRNERVLHATGLCLLASVGYGLVAVSTSAGMALAGFMIANVGVYSSLAIFWAIPQTFLAPGVKPAAIAFIASCGALFGGWLAPMAIGRIQGAMHNLASGLVVVSALFVVSALSVLLVGRLIAAKQRT
ncbi:MFS transporter [Burkholderia territorii]|uniref:MFS transporter n=1 Tax=Burkholderia territorii TaxID=1503055 RepID=UPI0007535F8E|nr:MFS transporter [Burkholderia territorii]KVQ61105.1 MFS transporter [Burkholderia territorii]KWA30887.1 MFS transporter [Burkholderia territorii]